MEDCVFGIQPSPPLLPSLEAPVLCWLRESQTIALVLDFRIQRRLFAVPLQCHFLKDGCWLVGDGWRGGIARYFFDRGGRQGRIFEPQDREDQASQQHPLPKQGLRIFLSAESDSTQQSWRPPISHWFPGKREPKPLWLVSGAQQDSRPAFLGISFRRTFFTASYTLSDNE